MLHSLATLRDLAAALKKVEEDYLEKFNLMAVVARVANGIGMSLPVVLIFKIEPLNLPYRILHVDATCCIG